MGKRPVDGQHKPYTPKPFALVYLTLVLIGTGLAFAAYLGILWIQSLPALGSSFQEKEAQARLEAVKVALTTVAGLAAASGLYVGYRRQRVEEFNSSREQDRVFTERFGAAANLLASENAAVRLAGVQSLARLADDSTRDQYTCLSALCSYLRLPVRLLEDSADASAERLRTLERAKWADPDEWDVRRNALRLLLERMNAEAPEPWDLRDAVLIEPDFTLGPIRAGIDARGAVIAGSATISLAAFGSTSRFDDCLFGASLDVIGSDPDITFAGSKVVGMFTFRMTDPVFVHPWGLMPVFERCEFAGGARMLTDLTDCISALNFQADTRSGERLMASSITLGLAGTSFSGKVSLSTHAIDVAGADFRNVDELEFIPYRGSAAMTPLEYDSATRWPEGFGDP